MNNGGSAAVDHIRRQKLTFTAEAGAQFTSGAGVPAVGEMNSRSRSARVAVGGRSASAIAQTIVHETKHDMNFRARPQISGWQDQRAATEAGWGFYQNLPAGLQDDPGYNAVLTRYKENPQAELRRVCLATGYSNPEKVCP
jgi:hypothetical protein